MMVGSYYDMLLAQGYTPEQIDQLMRAGVLQGEYGGAVPRQLAEAQRLRESEMPTGRRTSRLYVAANPLEFAGTTLDRLRGHREGMRAEERARRLLEEQARLRAMFLRGGRGPGPGAGAPLGPGAVSPGTAAPSGGSLLPGAGGGMEDLIFNRQGLY